MDNWIYIFAAYVLLGFRGFRIASNLKFSTFENANTSKSDSGKHLFDQSKIKNNETLINAKAEEKTTENANKIKCSFSSSKEDYPTIEERLASAAEVIVKGPEIHRFLPHFHEDGTFSDLDMHKYEHLREHARRLGAISYHEKEENGSLSDETVASFAFLTYDVPQIKSINWWSHLIGVPTVMWPTIFIAKAYLNETVMLDFLTRYFSKTEMGPVWNHDEISGRMAGGNLGPRMFFGLVENFLKGTLDKFHDQAKKMLHKEVILRDGWNGNGMRQDGCLHQHNQIIRRNPKDGNFTKIILSQVYNNNYGKEFLKNAAMIMWLFDGTPFDLGDEIEEGIFASFFECQQWLYRHTTVEPATVGRFIDSGDRVTRVGGLDAVARTLKLFLKIDRHQKEVIAALHRYYHQRPSREFALEGNKHFFVSDLMAHQRIGFMASLRLLSRRTCRPETIPSYSTFSAGNSKGYFMGDGFLTVLVTGKEAGSPKQEIFQAYDWSRIPGTTCQYTAQVPQVSTFSPSLKHSYNDADFVGGVTNRKEGLATMEYARPTIALRGKKSWFFFDDVILCLGSGIFLPVKDININPVITTLNQVIYEGNHTVGDKARYSEYFLKESMRGRRWTIYDMRDSTWFHHNSIGYVPLIHEGEIVLELDRRIVRRRSENTFIHTFSLWLDHGRQPSNSVYAYAVLPEKTAQKTSLFASNPTTKILSLNESLHAACFDPLKILGVVFFTSGCVNTTCLTSDFLLICTDEPILIILKTLPSPHAKEEHCPGGVQSPSGDTEERNITELERNDVTEKAPKDTINNLKEKMGYGYQDNEIKAMVSFILQISAADPTQKLIKFTLSLQEAKKTYDIPVLLPEPPKRGDSIIFCLEI